MENKNLDTKIANEILIARSRAASSENSGELGELLEALTSPETMDRALFVELSELEAKLERTMPVDEDKAVEQDALLAKVLTLMDTSPWMLSGTGGCIERPRKYAAPTQKRVAEKEYV